MKFKDDDKVKLNITPEELNKILTEKSDALTIHDIEELDFDKMRVSTKIDPYTGFLILVTNEKYNFNFIAVTIPDIKKEEFEIFIPEKYLELR